jgi:hypothetical protein
VNTTPSRIMRAKAISRLFVDDKESCTSAVPTHGRSLLPRRISTGDCWCKGRAKKAARVHCDA